MSINNEINVDFQVDGNAPQTSKYAQGQGSRVSLVEALIGANASGKTSVLKGLVLIKWLLADSANERRSLLRAYSPYKGNKKNTPTTLTVSFEVNEILYVYSVELVGDRIMRESLQTQSRTKVRDTKKTLFTRMWDKKRKVYELNDRAHMFTVPFHKMSEKDLQSASYIAIAKHFGDDLPKELVQYWKHVKTNIELRRIFAQYGFEAYEALRSYKKDKEAFLNPIGRYDLSISGFSADDGTLTHTYGDTSFTIDIDQESSGTQQFIVLMKKLNDVLKHGGIAVIDEFDAYLHPFMLNELVEQFFDPEKNPKNAQLIMSTHSHQILNLLDKYQTVIVEKREGETMVERLDQASNTPRSDDNYYAKYMAGKYGGVPNIR